MTDYSSVENITCLAMHKEKDLIFFGDSQGSIRRLNISSSNQIKTCKTIFRGSDKGNNITRINQISVDWLNNYIYFASSSKISRIELFGESYRDLIVGFDDGPSRTGLEGPFDLQVDPVNGYLYWSMKGSEKGGIYRLDLASFNGNKGSHIKGNDNHEEPIHYQTVPAVIHEPQVQTFTIDYLANKIFFPREKSTSGQVIIVSHNEDNHQKEERNVDNVQTSLFSNIKAMVYINNLFYWTNGSHFFREEFSAKYQKYFHNQFFVPAVQGDIISCLLFEQDLQPTPIPRSSVTELVAHVTDTTAKVSWKKPKRCSGQGVGFYQNWLYEISVSTPTNETLQEGLKDMFTRIAYLTPDTEYAFKVRAYTKAGRGPWGNTVRSRTLKRTETPGSEIPERPVLTIDTSRNKITWTRSPSRFGEFVHYELMAKNNDHSLNDWKVVYNGSGDDWYVSNLDYGRTYKIRVRASSKFGESHWSDEKLFYYAPPSETPKPEQQSSGHSSYFVAILSSVIFSIFVLACVYYCINSGEFVFMHLLWNLIHSVFLTSRKRYRRVCYS
jgi:hypothetical protein